MTRQAHTALLCGAILLLVASCGAGPEPSTAPSAPPDNPHADATFLNAAPVAVLEATTLARLAATKAGDPSVRSFATALNQDYTGIGQQLAPLARRDGVAAPTDMDAQHQILYHQLAAMSGQAFDRVYIEHQLQDQTTTIEVFQAEADSGKQPDLQGLARNSLPALMQGLRNANQLSQGR